jgi:hypothetical protein
MDAEHSEGNTMTIRKALILILVSAFSAIVAFFVEFSCAALLSWVGFGWPVRMLLYPGENLYRYLLSQGFYPHSSKLFIDMIFALKFDLVLNFLLFVWLFFSFPDLPRRLIPLKAEPRKPENQPSWMK